MTLTTTTALTPAAVTAAHRLARAYGHTWGHLDLHEVLALPALTPEAIERASMARLSEGPAGWGITAPTPDEYGDLVHTTGSGRLSWRIEPSGDAYVRVSRPGDLVVFAVSIRDGQIVPDEWTRTELAATRSRHLWAAREAVTALLGEAAGGEEFDRVFSEAWEIVAESEAAEIAAEVATIRKSLQRIGQQPGARDALARVASDVVRAMPPKGGADRWQDEVTAAAVRARLN